MAALGSAIAVAVAAVAAAAADGAVAEVAEEEEDDAVAVAACLLARLTLTRAPFLAAPVGGVEAVVLLVTCLLTRLVAAALAHFCTARTMMFEFVFYCRRRRLSYTSSVSASTRCACRCACDSSPLSSWTMAASSWRTCARSERTAPSTL